MNEDKKIWVLKPKDSLLWDAENGKNHEFVERNLVADWIMYKWRRGDVIVVEHIHANDSSKKGRV